MKKKLTLAILLLALLSLFAACEKNYVPNPAVEEYLNSGLTAERAFNQIATVNYTTVEISAKKNGEEQGKQTSVVSFDVSDKENLALTMHQTYSGTYVSDGVTEQTTTIVKSSGGYLYATETNIESKNKSQEVTAEFALDLITSLVYKDNGAYNGSGLYYGDLFMLKIYKFPAESFYVDTENDLCVFDDKMLIIREDVGNIRLYQTTKINRLGLLLSNYEKYESEDNDQVLISEVKVTYEFSQSNENQQ